MPEPTTTTSLSTLTLSAVSLLPFINGNALLGAVLGAAFIATYEKNLTALSRLRTMLLSTGIGYLLAPEITSRTFITSDATAALITSTFSLFILIKAVDWVKASKLSDLWKAFRGGSS
ncbi:MULTISPECIES: putative holin [Acinetobacter]|uniref:putative holin n=1 Tax=Acinetobacter TaxID=469 RepID=UPI00125FD869|nr:MULTISPECIES: putative holin [Acinetobacter]MBU3120795.1 phage holin family protein [Acinetobacter soli]MDA3431675.1 phage holin family protein [Acinetobacter baumannii]WON80835.1 phage holin family protein [Acinetobacter sp. UGAL515B_02]